MGQVCFPRGCDGGGATVRFRCLCVGIDSMPMSSLESKGAGLRMSARLQRVVQPHQITTL